MRKNLFITYVAFFLSLSCLIILSFNFYKRLTIYSTYNQVIEHTYTIINEIGKLENYLKDAETAQRGFLLTEDSAFLDPYLKFGVRIKPTFNQLLEQTKDNPTQQKYLAELNYAIARRMDYLDDALILFKSDKRVFVRRLREGRKSMDDCRALLHKMEEEEKRLLQLRSATKERYETSASVYSFGIFLFALIIFIITFLLIIREFRRKIIYQRKLEQNISELDQTNSELGQIAYVASHDLQEPLRKIRTFSDMFKAKFGPQSPREGMHIAERIQHSAIRMQELVEDLVNFTSLISIQEKPIRIPLKTVIEKVQGMMMPRFREKDVKLSIDFTLPSVTGYFHQLELLFECLLDNAIKFAKEGEPPLIFIFAQEAAPEEMKTKFDMKFNQQRFVKITIRDNGIGFDNAFAGKMFSLFQRLHAQHSEYEGKGIGLAMVRRIMTNHGGYVTALGKVNEGAEFVLYFPIV